MDTNNSKETGYFTLTGALMAVLCVYVLFGRLLGLYVFDKAAGIRRRLMVQVVVLDELADSSRMCAHAISLTESGCTVDFIGYNEKKPSAQITTNRHIRIRPIRKIKSVPEYYPSWIQLIWTSYRNVIISFQLFWVMACISQKPDFVIVQNPPFLPTIAVGKLVGILRKAWFIIDWQDTTSHKNQSASLFIKLTLWYERVFATTAYAHLAATKSIYHVLNEEKKVKGKLITVRDLPQSDHKRLGLERTHHVWSYSSLRYIHDTSKNSSNSDHTLFTEVSKDGTLRWRRDRPKVIVLPWPKQQEEEKTVHMVIEALKLYGTSAYPNDPRLLVVIYGCPKKSKSEYELLLNQKIMGDKVEKLQKIVSIVVADIERGDYPSLLGSADLGVSLDKGVLSSKSIVDMFGCGLPVCTVSFPSLDEYVKENETGLVFESSQDLAEQWTELFANNSRKLEELRHNLLKGHNVNSTWQSQYKELLYFLFDQNK